MHASTRFADYPLQMPDGKANTFEDYFPGWMLLSYNKKVEVSSSIDTLLSKNITDETLIEGFI